MQAYFEGYFWRRDCCLYIQLKEFNQSATSVASRFSRTPPASLVPLASCHMKPFSIAAGYFEASAQERGQTGIPRRQPSGRQSVEDPRQVRRGVYARALQRLTKVLPATLFFISNKKVKQKSRRHGRNTSKLLSIPYLYISEDLTFDLKERIEA